MEMTAPGRTARSRAAKRAKTSTAAKRKATQAERSTITRAKIIEGAIRCLNKHGYAATTFAMVSKESGVSRGGMLHQFPTKVDIMLAVVAQASGADEDAQADIAAAKLDPRRALMQLTDNTWRVMTLAPAMAKLEIVIAARSDKTLAAKLPGLYAKIEKRRREHVWQIAKAAGVRDKKRIEAMVTLHVAAMRGLALDLMITDDNAMVQQGYGLLKHYKDVLVRELLD